MGDHYILKGHEPVLCDLMAWAEWFETSFKERVVAQTEVSPGVLISTVFLGLDHSFGGGRPALFETMGFTDYGDTFCTRYSTWAEAELGHMEIVERETARLVGEDVST